MAFRKVKAGLVNSDIESFIGEIGNLFFDIETGILRLSDGTTPGGTIVSGGSGDGGTYTLPTATTSVKGGVKVDGTTITINNQIISATQQDLSSYATQSYVTSRGYLTSVGTISYNDLSNKPTLFSGSYTDLTDKPTIPSLTGYATESYVTTRGYITSYTETDPVFLAHAANNVTNTKISNWDTAYGWGNHASSGYLTSVGTISYTDLSNKPTLFSGSYADLTNKPTIPTSTSDLTNGAGYITSSALTGYATETYVTTRGYLTSVGTISYNDLSNKPTLFSGSYTDLTNKPTLFDGAYANLTGKPTLFSGSYTDLTDKPTIPTTVTVNGTAITLGSSGTVTAAAGTLTGTTLASGVTASSLTSVGTLTGLTVDSTSSTAVSITADGRPGSETNNWSFVSNQSIGGPRAWIQFPDNTLQTTAWTGSFSYNNLTDLPTLFSGSYTDLTDKPTIPTTVTVNGTAITLGSSGTVTAAAGTLTGTTLNSTIVSSSLTSVGTLTNLSVTNTITGSVSGNAGTVTNGVYTTDTGTVTNTMLAGSIANAKLSNSSVTINGTSVSLGASATVTAAAGTLTGTTLASGVTASSLTSVGTLTGVISNAVTAFTAGDAAISGVALQVPREGAIRNLYNGAANNMYFDVSIGGTSQGQFQFRSSSAFTNILTMSPTAFTVNTEAVVTARTPSFGRLPWNSALDTELTIDDYRWRITNSGGIYAQVISNTGGTKNSAWTAVAAISGSAVAQGGSTGILLPNNSWTTLYTFGSMASAGDTVTVTFQDKTQGRIYRITFMRSDDGATTGYNIIAERLL